MPFTRREEHITMYPDKDHWTEVYKWLIKPAIETAGLKPVRDDQDLSSRSVVEGIFKKIEAAEIVLCVLSSDNPNVMLELGWALRADKPYVLIKDEHTKYTFDLSAQYTCSYNSRLQPTALEESREKLSKTVQQTLKDTERSFSLVRSLAVTDVFAAQVQNAKGDDKVVLHAIQKLQKDVDAIRGVPDLDTATLRKLQHANMEQTLNIIMVMADIGKYTVHSWPDSDHIEVEISSDEGLSGIQVSTMADRIQDIPIPIIIRQGRSSLMLYNDAARGIKSRLEL